MTHPVTQYYIMVCDVHMRQNRISRDFLLTTQVSRRIYITDTLYPPGIYSSYPLTLWIRPVYNLVPLGYILHYNLISDLVIQFSKPSLREGLE